MRGTSKSREALAESGTHQSSSLAGTQASPAKGSTSWSTRPAPKRKASSAERQRADAAARAKEGWARRHPALAKAERGLRKERAQLLDRFKHKNEGTCETHEHARHQVGALARLYETGGIDRDQLAAAVEIAQVAERIGADVTVKTASLETRIDSGRHGDGTFFEKLSQVRHEVAYTRWRAEVRGLLRPGSGQAQDGRAVAAVLDMLVGETVGFTVVARRYRMHNRKAKKLLIDALDLWPKILGGVYKEINDATLGAAHIRLEAQF